MSYNGGFLLKEFDLVKISVPLDGHCFFHSLMLGTVQCYINSKSISEREKMVVAFRKRVANYLLKLDENGKSVYDKLSGGYLKEYAKYVTESKEEENYYDLKNLYSLLNSSKSVGLEVLEVVSLFLDVNIIIWDDFKKDIYRTADRELLFDSDRSTVVMIYDGFMHYNLMGLNTKNKVYTHFTNENPLIVKLINIW